MSRNSTVYLINTILIHRNVPLLASVYVGPAVVKKKETRRENENNLETEITR